MFFVFLLFALFASVFAVSKEALLHASPFFLVGVRMMVAGALLFIILAWKKELNLRLSFSCWKNIILLAIFNIYLTNVFEFWGLQYLTSFKTCFLYSLSPFLSAVTSFLVLDEKMSPKKWLGFFIGFAGFIPILFSQTNEEESAGALLYFSWAELSVLAAVFFSSYGWTLLRKIVQKDQLSPLLANSLSMLIGGALATCHSLLKEPWTPVPVVDFLPFLATSAFLIIVSNGICYNLAGFLLKRFSATFMSFAGLTTPLFCALLGYFIHGERTHLPFWASYSIVVLGLVVFYQEEREAKWQKKHMAPTSS
jgi:drug/metabolite transporter (DMT)-like permease